MSTPRYNLDTYNQGDDNWSHTDTVEFVDEHSIGRGPVSERPTSGNYDDEFYYATDQNVLWSWDESITDWIIRGGTGSEEQPLDSVHTEVLENGIAGEGNTISSVWGDSGEYILLGMRSFGEITFTNTSFTTIIPSNERFLVLSGNEFLNTNIDTFGFSWSGRISNNTEGETTNIRLRDGIGDSSDLTETNESVTGTDSIIKHSAVEDRNVDPMLIELRGSVTGGEGKIEWPNIYQWGKIA